MNLNLQNTSMLIDMSKNETVPKTLKAINDEVQKVSAVKPKEELEKIFADIDKEVGQLTKDVAQMKSILGIKAKQEVTGDTSK